MNTINHEHTRKCAEMCHSDMAGMKMTQNQREPVPPKTKNRMMLRNALGRQEKWNLQQHAGAPGEAKVQIPSLPNNKFNSITRRSNELRPTRMRTTGKGCRDKEDRTANARNETHNARPDTPIKPTAAMEIDHTWQTSVVRAQSSGPGIAVDDNGVGNDLVREPAGIFSKAGTGMLACTSTQKR